MNFGISGKNNGKGYYIYEKGSKPKPDPSVLSIIEESRRLTNIMPGGKVCTLASKIFYNLGMEFCPLTANFKIITW